MPRPVRVYDGFLPGRHAIEAYGAGGFRFGGMSHRGSLLALPDGVHRWPVSEGAALAEADFEVVLAQSADIDVFLIGTGSVPVRLPDAVRSLFQSLGLRHDVMTTSAAAMTYNVLLQENRRVAAGLVATI